MCIKYDGVSTGEVRYNVIHKKSVYEIQYPGGATEQLMANIIFVNVV